MNAMTHDGLPLTPEQQVAQLLAYYDARRVPAQKLRKIFNCPEEALNNARATDDYKSFAAAEEARIEEQARNSDELWNDLEARALGDLSDAMDSIADPKTLLGIAVQANKANRRANGFGQQKLDARAAIIDVNAQAGPTRVVRLRTRFAEMLMDDESTGRLMRRETEVTAEFSGAAVDHMDPATVKALMRNSLGVEPDKQHAQRKMVSDADFAELGNIDFSIDGEIL